MTATQVMETVKLVTADEYEQMESQFKNSDVRMDLIDGRLVEVTSLAGGEHGIVTMDFSYEIMSFVRQHNLGKCFAAETRFVIALNPDTSIAPDFAFMRADRVPNPMPKNYWRLVPDLVLEVRLPGDNTSKSQAKMNRWIRAGVRLGWELNPTTQILTVYRPGEAPQQLGVNDILTGEDVLPGFTLPLRRLFPDDASMPEM